MKGLEQDLERAAEMAVKTCLGVKPHEVLLVIADTETKDMGEALFNAGLKVGAEVIFMLMKPRTRHGEEPPKLIAEAWQHADVFIAPTKYSLTHTQARKRATEKGARGATMPGITKELFVRSMKVDYNKVRELATKMKSVLEGKKSIKIVTRKGSDLEFSIEGRPIIIDTGILHDKGSFGNLPAGEVFVAPIEGTAQGTLVIDGAIAGVGIVKHPVKIVVRDGFVVSIEGMDEARKLNDLLASVGKKEAFNVAEFGIGCNMGVEVVGNILVDEKVFGTTHVAFGDNSTIGGKTIAGIHIDGIIYEPTVYVDGAKVIEDGKWLV
ncbi:MAG: aminopeptidase [Candidatus Nezhaarchaeota archaeon]|nr:aminopeptidase [Candidatus Nezhaarchaeota archaeon]MCX8141171.1 aminopeptidase [Candidatus Nezhaarchaeota archaeon]MDW8050826.1 aminopeptidase [Nitrososphaerota archaeon]